MSRAPASFRKADVVRALAAATKAGWDVGRVEIDPEGRIVMIREQQPETSKSGNSFDRLLADNGLKS